MNLLAIWDGEQYVVAVNGWSSVDGDNWVTQNGLPVADAAFELATITLIDGARAGEQVR